MTATLPPLLNKAELLDASILLTKRHFVTILRIALPALAVTLVVDLTTEALAPDSVLPLLSIPVSFVAWGAAEGMALAAYWHLLHGNPMTRGSCWELVARRPWAVVLGYSLKWIPIVIGLFLLIMPGLYLIARWFAVPMASVAEGVSFRQAFDRSRRLSELELGRVMGTIGLVELGLMVVVGGFSVLIPDSVGELAPVYRAAVYWLLGVVLLPLRTALTVLLYVDIRMRREGYDLQVALSGG